jgi:hypothetical protein
VGVGGLGRFDADRRDVELRILAKETGRIVEYLDRVLGASGPGVGIR